MLFPVRALLFAFIALMSAFSGGSADADTFAKPTSPEAKEHLKRGNRLYLVRSFDEAIAEYKAGALLEPLPVFDYNLGQCYRLTAKYPEAIWHYERFMRYGQPEGERLEAIKTFIAEMNAELERQKATVPAPAQKPREPAPVNPSPTDSVSPPGLSTTTTSKGSVHSSRLGWGLTAVGLVGASVSTWLLFNSASLEKDAKDEARPHTMRLELQDRADSRRRDAVILGAGGGVLTVAGIVLLLLPARSPESDSRTSMHLQILSNGFAVSGGF